MDNPSLISITDVADIYTTPQYYKKKEKNNLRDGACYILYKRKAAIGEMRAIISNLSPSDDSLIICPKKINISYLTFILNSIPCVTTLLEGNIYKSKKTPISSRKLSSISIPFVDETMQEIYGLADILRGDILDKHQNEENDNFKYFYMLFSDLSNSLSLELYLRPNIGDKGEDLLKTWVMIAKTFMKDSDISKVLSSLSDTKGELRNQIMKFQVLLSNMNSKK